MNKNEDGKWVVITLGVIIIALLATYFIYGMYLGIKAEKICKKECTAYGGLYSETIHNGKMNTDDLCICYLDDGTKSWRLGER